MNHPMQYGQAICKIYNKSFVSFVLKLHFIFFLLFFPDNFCYYSDNSDKYLGTVNITENNKPCLKWKTADHSYCRNPDNMLKDRPWCFTSENDFGYCDVQQCGNYILTHNAFLFLLLEKLTNPFSFFVYLY